MYQNTYPVVSTKNLKLVLVSDLHIGLKGFRADLYQKLLAELAEDNTYWVALGDVVEGREPGHKFYDYSETSMSVGEQYDYFFNSIQPFTERCIGMHIGNHEESLIKRTTINPIMQFCVGARIPYLGTLGRTRFISPDDDYCDILSMHGAGGGNTGAAINKALSYAQGFDPDLVVLGHHHKMSHVISPKSVIDERGKISFSPRHSVIAGSLLDGFVEGLSSYSESKMMSPTLPGYAIIDFDKNMKIDTVRFRV